MSDSGRKWLYSLRRELHFTSGFVIRNSGEIGIFLFLILFGLLVMGVINGDSKPEYLLGLVAAFGAYAAFVTQQRGKMHDIMKGFDEDFSKLRATRRKLAKKLQDKNSQAFESEDMEIDDIMDFFDTVGFSIMSGALSFTLADESYTYWAVRYYETCKERIKYYQRKDELAYKSFEWFVNRIAIKGETNEVALLEFIKEEASDD